MPRIQYDYESVLARLENSLSTILKDADISGYSTSQRLLETVAEELNQLAAYTEYLTRESKWSLCQNLSSIMTMASLFGYPVHRKVGSTGYVRVSTSSTFDSTYKNNVVIPRFSSFKSSSLYFTSTAEGILTSSSFFVDIPVVQGQPVVHTEVVSTTNLSDLSRYSIHIENNSTENINLRVTVNGIEYTQVDYLKQGTSSTGRHYVVENDLDMQGITVRLGDGYTGSRLSNGDVVEITYVVTEGAGGNLDNTGAIDTVVSSISDTTGYPVTLYCTNIDVLTGGSDYETIDEIRYRAPNRQRTRDVIVTIGDYRSYIESLDGLGADTVVRVWGWGEQMEDKNLPASNYEYDYTDEVYRQQDETVFGSNRVYLCGIYLNSSNHTVESLSRDKKDYIYTAIKNKKPLTDSVIFLDPVVTYFRMRVRVFYDTTQYTDSTKVVSQVRDALVSRYSFIGADSQDEYYSSLYSSEYSSLIQNLDSVSYSTADVRMYQIRESDGAESTVGLVMKDLDLMHNNLAPGKIYIYIKKKSEPESEWSLVAVDQLVSTTEAKIRYGKLVPVTSGMVDSNVWEHTNARYRNITVTPSATIDNGYFCYSLGRFDVTNATQTVESLSVVLTADHSDDEFGTSTPVGGTDYEYRIEFVTDQTSHDIVLTNRRQVRGLSYTGISILTYAIESSYNADTEEWNDVWDGHGVDRDTD